MIEVQNITKRFGPITAVDGVSFEVQKGEVVGFLGPNGAGKTTTMRILTGFIPATDGTAKLAGFDVFENSLEVRKRVGYLPESAPLYLDMGVVEFLEYIASMRGIVPAKRKASLDKMIEVCGLSAVLKQEIGELSRGFRQRVGMAQAMIHDPEILIMDEPTSGLDPNQIIGIRALIKELGKEKTVILSTHILSEVEATCSRVIIIDRGKIVADGSLDEVTKRGKVGKVHHLRVRGDRPAWETKLKSLAGVKSFNWKEEKGGLHRYEVFTEGDRGLGEELFRLAADSGMTLSELFQEKTTLENVFTQLTQKES
jgi:ABC-2 type transport system ATP-binding protein